MLAILAILSTGYSIAYKPTQPAVLAVLEGSAPHSTPLIRCNVGLVLPLLMVGLMIARSIIIAKKKKQP